MTTDEQLIERIQSALHEETDRLAPPAELLASLRAEPDIRAGSRVAPRLVSRVLVAALLAVAVAIGVGAVLVLHSNNRPAGQQTAASSDRGLLGVLGVLRRPQTAADRNLGPYLTAILGRLARGAKPVMSLARLATVAPDGRKVFVVPMQAPAGGVWPSVPGGRGGPGLRLAVLGDGATCCIAAGQITSGIAWLTTGGRGGNQVVVVVPDAVARVRFDSVSAPVHNNVAVLVVRNPVENAGAYNMTWFSAAGRVISSSARPTRTRRQRANERRLLVRSAREPIALALIEHFAVFRTQEAPIEPLPAFARVSLAADPQKLNIDKARFVRYPGTSGFWVIPGRVGVAMATTDTRPSGLASSGAPVGRVLGDREITTEGSAPPRELVYGLVPDGNRTVTIKLADGAIKVVRVIDNVYAVTLTQRPQTLLAKNANGTPTAVRVPG